MSEETISLLQAIKSGSFEASLITTFNATLSFYEDVVLRKLLSAGSRYNVVMMDRAQCARSFATPSLRPRFAGASYTLAPLAAPGAFHPKICILAGKRRSVLLVGSHNLTLSGFGFNREVTNWVEVKAGSGAGHRLALAHAWSLVQDWVRTQGSSLPEELSNAIRRFGEYLPAEPAALPAPTDMRLLGQSSSGPSLLDQLVSAIPRAPVRVAVVGAFFDKNHGFLRAIEARWPAAEIRVVIEPSTVKIGRSPSDLRARFVDVRSIWPTQLDKYLHAKAMLLDFGGSFMLASGSANPSRPAWLGGSRANFEVMLLRAGLSEADQPLVRDLLMALSARVMTDTELRSIQPAALENENELDTPATPVTVAASRPPEGTVVVPAELSSGMTSAVAFLADGTSAPLSLVRSDAGDAVVTLGSNCGYVRWLEFEGGSGRRRLRVIVHHTQSVGSAAGKSGRSDLRHALANLEFSGVGMEELIRLAHKAIFDDELEVVARPGSSGPNANHVVDVPRPASLGIHAPLPPTDRKRRALREGNIIEVLDALLRRMRSAPTTGGPDHERMDPVSEEENVGRENPQEEAGVPVPITDERVVAAVRSKIRALIKRMVRQLKTAGESAKRARTALVQLVAVLSLIREFRRLRHQFEWRMMGGFVDEEDRRGLLDAAIACIYGNESGCHRLLLDADGDEPEELGQVRALLAWLTWDLGGELAGEISLLDEPEKQQKRAIFYSYLFLLMSRVAVDEGEAALLRASVALTQKPTAEEGANALAWLNRHLWIGEELATAPDPTFDDRERLRIGDLLRVPKSTPARIRVVTKVTAQSVTVTEFDSERSFQRGARL
jgi:hypothetical protein